jgi:hypothetical protein
VNAKVTNSDSTPASGVITNFVINNTSIAAFTGSSDQKTNNDGIAIIEIQGMRKQEQHLLLQEQL